MTPDQKPQIILFDFGGVLAEEGYRKGLYAIARMHNLDPEKFFQAVTDIIYACGFVTGTEKESVFWQLVRGRTGITGTDETFRNEILKRFILRPKMLDIVRQLRTKGLRPSILSDQTLWLDELDAANHFSKEFDKVYNSYHLGKSKRDPAVFTDTANDLGTPIGSILFVDDNPANIDRAARQGMQTHLFTSAAAFQQYLKTVQIL